MRIPALTEEPARGHGVPLASGVVARGDGLGFPGEGPTEERSELDLSIAHHTRARRPACAILLGEVGNNRLRKLTLVVQEVIGNAQLARDGACARGRGGRAARPEPPGFFAGLCPRRCAKGHPDDVVSLLN